MEKERGSKVIAIVALLIAVVGLSVGFAAYTSTLTISDTSATVGASSTTDFSVVFSTTGTGSANDDTTIAKLVQNASVTGGATAVLSTAEGVTPSMSGTTISGLSANFTQPGESVTYTLYAHNTGKFAAYLNALTIGEKSCVANTGTTQSLVDAVCPSITMSVKVGSTGGDNGTTTSLNSGAINNHILGIGLYDTITIKLDYAETEARVDGDFTVNFGQITLTYDQIEKN